MKRVCLSLLVFILISFALKAQTERDIKEIEDSLYIDEVENKKEPDKVLHAEPLYIDLIRDLGARKGEKEWNVAVGLTDNGDYDKYTGLIEYEWAPIHRLGLEIELPFSFYYPINGNAAAQSNKLNSLKLATQYSFYVSEKNKMTAAVGYIHEFELVEFDQYRYSKIFSGNVFNPFLIAAKRFGNNFHSMIYTGPVFNHHFHSRHYNKQWQVNTNFHYMISGTRNFVGIEFNKYLQNRNFDMVIRPQMRLGIADNLLVGIVTGIPISRHNERLSSFIRLIYEPGYKEHRH
ncbi:MAG: phosphoribosylformylglycinamidine synthase [Bacteroidia bacterium]|nr:phosphoribosylformylglycinamidine synthase [Bacteroidia bacterium]MDW8301498.1 HAEPLYID family protein [Bacteroidia bacterium]